VKKRRGIDIALYLVVGGGGVVFFLTWLITGSTYTGWIYSVLGTVYLFMPIGIGFYVGWDLHRNPVGYILLSIILPIAGWMAAGVAREKTQTLMADIPMDKETNVPGAW